MKKEQELALQQNIQTLRNRVNELGVAEPIIQQQGADRIVVQLAGVQDPGRAKEILGRTATLEVRLVSEEHAAGPGQSAFAAYKDQPAPFGTDKFFDTEGNTVLVKKTLVITGDRIKDAQPGFDQRDGRPVVSMALDDTGGRIMRQTTRENLKKRMGMMLVERNSTVVLTWPVIQEEFGNRFQISGIGDVQEARNLALLLRAGALAAPMDIIEERTVGPSLGAENIAKGFKSVLYGFTAIAAFMIVYYALFGVISVTALAANLLFLVALLSMLQATLTLPGIAAIALALGMAIDANVLINERIREELRAGMSPQMAIQVGYERAFDTIFDSNITTLIAGLSLLAFGSGPVRGFAVVHCLGILTSIFSAVMVSRGIVNLIYGGRKKVARCRSETPTGTRRRRPERRSGTPRQGPRRWNSSRSGAASCSASKPGEGSCCGFQLGKCRGACVGRETALMHGMRLKLALSSLKLKRWPFGGASRCASAVRGISSNTMSARTGHTSEPRATTRNSPGSPGPTRIAYSMPMSTASSCAISRSMRRSTGSICAL